MHHLSLLPSCAQEREVTIREIREALARSGCDVDDDDDEEDARRRAGEKEEGQRRIDERRGRRLVRWMRMTRGGE